MIRWTRTRTGRRRWRWFIRNINRGNWFKCWMYWRRAWETGTRAGTWATWTTWTACRWIFQANWTLIISWFTPNISLFSHLSNNLISFHSFPSQPDSKCMGSGKFCSSSTISNCRRSLIVIGCCSSCSGCSGCVGCCLTNRGGRWR